MNYLSNVIKKQGSGRQIPGWTQQSLFSLCHEPKLTPGWLRSLTGKVDLRGSPLFSSPTFSDTTPGLIQPACWLNLGSEGADNYYYLPCHDALFCGDSPVRVFLSKTVPIINNNSKNAENVRLKKI